MLFKRNCAGCHGADGMLGPAPPLNDPLFLAIVPDDELTKAIRNGRPGTPMPGFSRESGGSLTSEQIEAIAHGLKKHWASGPKAEESVPAYFASATEPSSDTKRGEQIFARACAPCHGTNGLGQDGQNIINDRAFLALISDQALRRLIITGRADLGMPAYNERQARPADFQPLTNSDIADLVALLTTWRGTSGPVANTP